MSLIMLTSISKSEKTSMLMTKKKEEELKQIHYIWYCIIFKDQTKALVDLESKVNVMS